MTDDAFLDALGRRFFRPFFDSAHPHTGLVPGIFGSDAPACPAATGFALAALAVGAERGWESRAECRACAERVLRILWRDAAQRHGFFLPALDLRTGQAVGTAAPCVLDSAELVFGAFAAARYFGGAVAELAAAVEARIEWPRAVSPEGLLLRELSPDSTALPGPAPTWDRFGPHLSATWFVAREATRPAVDSVWTGWRRDLADTAQASSARLGEQQAFQTWLDWRAYRDPCDASANAFVRACETARALLAEPDLGGLGADQALLAGSLPFAPDLALAALRHAGEVAVPNRARAAGAALLLSENHRSGLPWALLGPWSPTG